jgi:hypothetical protein
LLEVDPFDRRRFCECCALPTLAIPDRPDGSLEWECAGTACDLCGWESRPLDVNGAPCTDDVSDEDRNDGMSLEAARANVKLFSSIYDPGQLPEWMLSPPKEAVRQAREALALAYRAVLDTSVSEFSDRYARWEAVREWEAELRECLRVQQQTDEDLASGAT